MTPPPVNILLVDDQPAKLLSYEAILDELGERLIKAGSARAALEVLVHTDVAVILMDVCMPELDGFELAALIREHPRFQDSAIIFVSGIAVADLDRLRGYRLGAVDYVSVPIVPELLRAKVRVFAELYRKTQQLAALNRELEQRVLERTAALRASEERLVLALESAGGASWDWEAHPDRLEWAPRFAELHRLAHDETPTLRDVLARAHPDDRERLLGRLERMLSTPGDDAWCEEFRIEHPLGGYRYLSSNARAFRDAQGRVVRITGIDLDVTDRTLGEQALREDDRRKDAFLAMLSHELRTPLAPLVNGLDVLCRPDLSDGRRDAVHGVMRRQLEQLTRLVNDLLDVSRIASDKIEVRRERVDLRDAVHRAVESCRHAFAARGIQLEWRGVDDLFVRGDLARLVQVVVNLLHNAAKYTDEGGSVVVETRRDHADVLVAVRDTGIGIAPEVLPRVFDLFAQAAMDPARTGGGLGIGLALVRRMVALHDGSVTAASAGQGKGSEFVVRLPALDDDAPAPPHAPTAADAPPRRVLVADDNAEAVAMLELLLQSRGHDVRSAADGLDAVALAEVFRPEVAILDIGMPGLDGYGVARWIRAQPWGTDVLLVAQTGWGQPDDRRLAREAGFDVHLTKPVAFDRLERTLAEVGSRRTLADELEPSS